MEQRPTRPHPVGSHAGADSSNALAPPQAAHQFGSSHGSRSSYFQMLSGIASDLDIMLQDLCSTYPFPAGQGHTDMASPQPPSPAGQGNVTHQNWKEEGSPSRPGGTGGSPEQDKGHSGTTQEFFGPDDSSKPQVPPNSQVLLTGLIEDLEKGLTEARMSRKSSQPKASYYQVPPALVVAKHPPSPNRYPPQGSSHAQHHFPTAAVIPEQPKYISVVERLKRTDSVWYHPEMGRAGATHMLQGKDVGTFLVRQGTKPGTLVLSFRAPESFEEYIVHYLIEKTPTGLQVEGAERCFPDVPSLVAHYCQHKDGLVCQLCLPTAIAHAKTYTELAAIALLGPEFWVSKYHQSKSTVILAPPPTSPSRKQQHRRSDPILIARPSLSSHSSLEESPKTDMSSKNVSLLGTSPPPNSNTHGILEAQLQALESSVRIRPSAEPSPTQTSWASWGWPPHSPDRNYYATTKNPPSPQRKPSLEFLNPVYFSENIPPPTTRAPPRPAEYQTTTTITSQVVTAATVSSSHHQDTDRSDSSVSLPAPPSFARRRQGNLSVTKADRDSGYKTPPHALSDHEGEFIDYSKPKRKVFVNSIEQETSDPGVGLSVESIDGEETQTSSTPSSGYGETQRTHSSLSNQWSEFDPLVSIPEMGSLEDSPRQALGVSPATFHRTQDTVLHQSLQNRSMLSETSDAGKVQTFYPRLLDGQGKEPSTHGKRSQMSSSGYAEIEEVSPGNGHIPTQPEGSSDETDDDVFDGRKRGSKNILPAKKLRHRGSAAFKQIKASALNLKKKPGRDSTTKIQEHIIKLADNKNSTFGLTIDNFIQCTQESAETNPAVVIRNVRQFMSGMKNYLLTQGEANLDELIHKEQQKHDRRNPLPLDTIIEGALYECVLKHLRSHLYKCYIQQYTKTGDLDILTRNMKAARRQTPEELGVKASIVPPTGSSLDVIRDFLHCMELEHSPPKKLEYLLAAVSSIYNSVKDTSRQESSTLSMGADDFLPVFIYVLAHCNLTHAEIEAEYMWSLLNPHLVNGEGGYYLTTLSSAIHVLKNLENTEPTTGRERVPSVSDVQGFMKIAIFNQRHGTIVNKTLPVRQDMTAKEVCCMISHKFKLANADNFKLVQVVKGEETLIPDNAFPQSVRLQLEAEGKPCMFVFKSKGSKVIRPAAR
ncbi:ras and Rab interactor 2-like isoform X1 [Branchiostoma floridae x Branchiostoma belcheri]